MKPRRKGRDLAETRKEILDAAFHEIHAEGFHASSVDSILERTELTKGALFHQFGSKLELGYAVVEEVILPMTLARWVEPLTAFDDPLEGILHQLEVNIGEAPQTMLNLGCPVNNLVQEMASADPPFQKRLRKVIEAWIAGIEAHVKRGQATGHVLGAVDARSVAEYVVVAHEGVFGIVKVLQSKSALSALLGSMKTYFAGISGPRRRGKRTTPR